MIGHHNINFNYFTMIFDSRVVLVFMLRWLIFYDSCFTCRRCGVELKSECSSTNITISCINHCIYVSAADTFLLFSYLLQCPVWKHGVKSCSWHSLRSRHVLENVISISQDTLKHVISILKDMLKHVISISQDTLKHVI